MGLVRLLGFAKLPCGCVIGNYRELATRREVVYVEEKGPGCQCPSHRRNQATSVGAVPGPRRHVVRLARVS